MPSIGIENKHKMINCKRYFLDMDQSKLPYKLDIYELLNRTSSRIVRVAAASVVAQEFRIVLPPKVTLRIVRAGSIRKLRMKF